MLLCESPKELLLVTLRFGSEKKLIREPRAESHMRDLDFPE